ncbi:dynamin [Plakobranchus ocellatus]|uniref:Dynamin n=1 Tax=Plakobranchus ocellatus TaxID=259542 RepID=A0AAV3YIU1_9GAST|nr:dynamin [Plakobranchus ocellatus]
MEALHGKWKLDRSKNINVEEFLTAQGYPQDLVEKVSNAEGSFEASADGGKTRVVITSTGRPSTSHLIALDEPFQLSTPEGITMTCTVTAEGEGRFREHYTNKAQGVEFTTVREVKGKQMKTETSAKGGCMIQFFNKV